MKQFDVYANADDETRGFIPRVVIVSSHYLPLDNVLVAPLLLRATTMTEVEVPLVFAGVEHALSLMLMTALPVARLRRKVGSVAEHEAEIRRALDRLFTGF